MPDLLFVTKETQGSARKVVERFRQGKNRRRSAVYVLQMSILSLFLTPHHRAQALFVKSLAHYSKTIDPHIGISFRWAAGAAGLQRVVLERKSGA